MYRWNPMFVTSMLPCSSFTTSNKSIIRCICLSAVYLNSADWKWLLSKSFSCKHGWLAHFILSLLKVWLPLKKEIFSLDVFVLSAFLLFVLPCCISTQTACDTHWMLRCFKRCLFLLFIILLVWIAIQNDLFSFVMYGLACTLQCSSVFA